MNSENILYLGLKNRVMAVSKLDGSILWTRNLPGSMGDSFVTLLPDGKRIFAYTHGQLHCLDSADGSLLWSNGLPGCGYGIASLALPDGTTAPNAATIAAIIAAQRRSSSDTAGASTT